MVVNMKKLYIILITVFVLLLTVAGIFIYERAHASLYTDNDYNITSDVIYEE